MRSGFVYNSKWQTIFRQNMTRDRLLHLLRFVHFADNYLYYMEGTMGSVWPQAEIKINKK